MNSRENMLDYLTNRRDLLRKSSTSQPQVVNTANCATTMDCCVSALKRKCTFIYTKTRLSAKIPVDFDDESSTIQ
jgi:hypothetical protein